MANGQRSGMHVQHLHKPEKPAKQPGSRTFGTKNGPITGVVMVARKRNDSGSVGMTAWSWWVLSIDPKDGQTYSYWFNTRREWSDRSNEAHYVGENVDLDSQRKLTDVGDYEYDARHKGYTMIEDPAYWPVQCQADISMVAE